MSRPDLTGLRLAVQGLWFRRSTALIVLVLATVASAASVVAPLYARAAEESILRDVLRRADAFTLSVQVAVPQVGAGVGEGAAVDAAGAEKVVRRHLTHPAFGEPRRASSATARSSARSSSATARASTCRPSWGAARRTRPRG